MEDFGVWWIIASEQSLDKLPLFLWVVLVVVVVELLLLLIIFDSILLQALVSIASGLTFGSY